MLLEVRHNALLREVWELFERREYLGRIHAFHFAGHASGNWLAFEDDDGAPARASAGGLAGFLGRQPGLVLVFLNGCSTHEQVQRLRRFVPAVIATTETIRDDVAAAFAARFYAGLTGKPLRRAFLDARDFIEAEYGDEPSAVTREARLEPTEGPAGWPWRLDCDEKAANWRLEVGAGDSTVAAPPLPPPPTPSRTSKLTWAGLATVVLAGSVWFASTGPRPLPPARPAPPLLEMSSIPAGSARICEGAVGTECHRVTVPAFCVSTTETTQAQWMELTGSNPSELQPGDSMIPANGITWVAALQFANQLSDHESLSRCYATTPEGWEAIPSCEGYRLLTALEWARLAQAHGAPTCANANLADYDFLRHAPELEQRYRKRIGSILPFDCGYEPMVGDGHGRLAPVGSMQPGPYGLMDLQGNVAEWVWDAARDVAIVRGHSFAWPGRNNQELDAHSPPAMPPDFTDMAIGVRYARHARAAEGSPSAAQCSPR